MRRHRRTKNIPKINEKICATSLKEFFFFETHALQKPNP